jgi:thymidine kinase
MLLNQKTSYLKLIIGPMMSSKSTRLISEIEKYKHITDNILVVNHIFDKQRNSINCIKTHDDKVYPSIMLNNIYDLQRDENYINADIVIIDESQFYKDLYNFMSNELKNVNKVFIISGLSGDYNMNPIGEIHLLISLADSIEKLSALCIYCKDGTLASFTKLIVKSDKQETQILIGRSEKYTPVCRYHHAFPL